MRSCTQECKLSPRPVEAVGVTRGFILRVIEGHRIFILSYLLADSEIFRE